MNADRTSGSRLDQIEKAAVTVLLGSMTLVVFLQVVFRFVVKGSLPWSEELARYLMIWAIFFGASMGAKVGAHIGVEAVVKLLPANWHRPMIAVSCFFSLLFCAAVFWLSGQVVLNIYRNGQVSPAMEIPMYWAYLAVPAGALLMGIRFVQAATVNWRKVKGGET